MALQRQFLMMYLCGFTPSTRPRFQLGTPPSATHLESVTTMTTPHMRRSRSPRTTAFATLVLLLLTTTGCTINLGEATSARTGTGIRAGGANAPTDPASQETGGPIGEVKPVDDSTAMSGERKTSGNCSVVAPAEWVVTTGPNSENLLAEAPPGSANAATAGWLVAGVVSSYAETAPFYGQDPNLYSRDPGTAALAYVNFIPRGANLPLLNYVDQGQPYGSYVIREVRSPNIRGYVLYQAFQGDGMTFDYALTVRFGIAAIDAPDPLTAEKATQVAGTILCTTQLRQVNFDVDLGRQNSSSKKEDDGSGYNPWTGTEWVNDPSTGQRWLVDSSNWSENGPDGPGYYKVNGNDVTRLSPGFG